MTDCHWRKVRQPIGSGSSASARAKIMAAKNSPEINVAEIGLKCINGFSEKLATLYVPAWASDNPFRVFFQTAASEETTKLLGENRD